MATTCIISPERSPFSPSLMATEMAWCCLGPVCRHWQLEIVLDPSQNMVCLDPAPECGFPASMFPNPNFLNPSASLADLSEVQKAASSAHPADEQESAPSMTPSLYPSAPFLDDAWRAPQGHGRTVWLSSKIIKARHATKTSRNNKADN